MSNSLISAALAMISESREVNDILTELLSADGNGARVIILVDIRYNGLMKCRDSSKASIKFCSPG